MVEAGWDPSLAYMTTIVELMKAGKIDQDTNKMLSERQGHPAIGWSP